jgi:hypothetical protein
MMTENYLQNNQNLNLQLYHFSLGIQGEYNSPLEGESKSFNSLKRFGQASNNITANSNNITGDLNLTGAAILSDNLNLNIQGNLNKKDLQDTYYSESYGLGLQVAIPIGGKSSNSTSSSTPTPSTNNSVNNQSPAQPSPKGSTTISASYQQNEAKRTTYATIGSLSDYQNGSLALVSDTKTMINGDFAASLTIDHRLFSESGRADIKREARELPQNLEKNPLTPMGITKLIEDYTGQEMSWKPGDVARFKEKGREFETAVVGANTIGKANTIDPKNPKDADRLWLIGQPLSADPKHIICGACEGSLMSKVTNPVRGMNAMSVFHDKFTEETFLGKPGLLELSIIPAIPITYYGLIGKSIKNLYDQPKNSNSTGGKP